MSRETLVCDAGPVIALAKINRLELLQDLGDDVELVLPLLTAARQEGYWLSDELLKAVKSLVNE